MKEMGEGGNQKLIASGMWTQCLIQNPVLILFVFIGMSLSKFTGRRWTFHKSSPPAVPDILQGLQTCRNYDR